MYQANRKNKRKLPVKSNVDFRKLWILLPVFFIFQVAATGLAEDEDAASHRNCNRYTHYQCTTAAGWHFGRRDMAECSCPRRLSPTRT